MNDTFTCIELPDECLLQIAAFMDLNKSASVCKAFQTVSSDVASHLLLQRPVDGTYIQRLARRVQASKQDVHEYGATRLPHPRLLWKYADIVPMRTTRIKRAGPSVMLPSGNMVTFRTEGSDPTNAVVRMTNTRTMELMMEAPLCFPYTPKRWDGLFYTNGHVVLHTKYDIHQFIFVFKVGEEPSPSVELKYYKGPFNSSNLRAVTVAADSTMYLLWKDELEPGQEVSYEIQALDVATDDQISSRTVSMPRVAAEGPPDGTKESLVVAGNYILMFRCIKEGRFIHSHDEKSFPGPFPAQGIGAYSFRHQDLSQVDYLACFDQRAGRILHDLSTCKSDCVIYEDAHLSFDLRGHLCQKVSVNSNDGTLSIEDCATRMLGEVPRMLLTTRRTYFQSFYDYHDPALIVEERDLVSSQVLRALTIDIAYRDNLEFQPWVLASPERGELFVMHFCFRDTGHTISTFPLLSHDE